ncbi:hypothetical protein QBC46DRAFT_340864 [Diplogelasinospora grovesii]|uniref:Uncharacterized protein n=1 Tax=Diplogelasinospora grovesii TaxID=303347 RepID=A0AAN6N8G1_9PEZI|nr:hypothetical protein QBC46DRAFT_340864 [Diplogelasinospora grovesii]
MTVAESGSHPGVIGAAVVILIHGFESLSQQMVILEQRPRETPSNSWNPNTPAPARSEVWDTYLLRGFTGDLVPALSTKAAVYSGIMATEIP